MENTIEIRNTEDLKRLAKVARKIYVTIPVGDHRVMAQVNKHQFMDKLASIVDNSDVSGVFNGADINISGV